MENFIYKIANYFWNPSSPTSKIPKISHTHSKNPITGPTLSCMQNIIQTVGLQKSSFINKLKVTMKPIGTFLWKNFYCRLYNILTKVGLFSTYKKEPKALLIQQANQSEIPYKQAIAFPAVKPTIAIALISEEAKFDTVQVIKPLIAYGLNIASQSETTYEYEQAAMFSIENPTITIALISEEPKFDTAKIVKNPLTAIASRKKRPIAQTFLPFLKNLPLVLYWKKKK